MSESSAEDAASFVSDAIRARTIDSDALIAVGRAGWVAKGVIYVLIGSIAVPIALQGGGSGSASGDEASRRGAIAEIAQHAFSAVLLFAVAVGLALYALWRLTTALMPGDSHEVTTWLHRLAYVFSAVVYAVLAWSAVVLAFADSSGSGGSGNESLPERGSRWILERWGGRWLLGAAAIAGLGVAGYFVYKGIQGKFMEQIDLSDASATERTLIDRLGTIGWLGRGIIVALLSAFVLEAAINVEPDEAQGLDQALRETADTWWGSTLVLIAGVALIGYGAFAAISARHRRLVGP